MEKIGTILNGDVNEVSSEYTVAKITSFKFVPLTLVEVEKTFSMYNPLLCSNSQRLTLEKLTQIFCIYCNAYINYTFLNYQ